jgi:F-type H+-transporting ATPase subunit a
LPIVGPITIGEHHTPLFRGGVADLNMTFGLAIVTIIAAQVYAFKYLGFKGNMGRYFVNPLRDPIMSFVTSILLIFPPRFSSPASRLTSSKPLRPVLRLAFVA